MLQEFDIDILDFLFKCSLHLLFLTAYWHMREGVYKHSSHLRSRDLLNVWLWNFYQISSTIGRHEIQKKIWCNSSFSVNYESAKSIHSNSLFSGNATSAHSSFTKLCRIINIDVRNWPWKFQFDILKIGYIQNNL